MVVQPSLSHLALQVFRGQQTSLALQRGAHKSCLQQRCERLLTLELCANKAQSILLAYYPYSSRASCGDISCPQGCLDKSRILQESVEWRFFRGRLSINRPARRRPKHIQVCNISP